MSTVIIVENLGKRYTLHHQQREQYTALRDVITNGVRSLTKKVFSPFTLHLSPLSASEDFWALKDVSFEVKQGDRIGIIGRNGAGKSTLLKILSRITEPTTGSIRIKGRVASLLEVGTGFHPELTGRENIYLNGAILGMGRQEIRKKFDEIVDFAEIEKFLDTPVKRYSSGMYVRLAFAVAAHLEPEILIVDEVLAVGDAQFQKKCLGKMQDVGKEGRTVLFVSHNMGAVSKLCNNGVLLKEGKVILNTEVDKVVGEYLRSGIQYHKIDKRNFVGSLTSAIELEEIFVNGVDESETLILPSSEIVISVKGKCDHNLPNFRITFSIFKDEIRLLTQHDTQHPELLPKGKFESRISIPPFFLRPGEYSIAIGGYRDGMNDWIWGTCLKMFCVTEEWNLQNEAINLGIVNIPFKGDRII